MHLLTQTVGWLGRVVGSYFALLLVWTIWTRRTTTPAIKWTSWINKSKRFRENARGLIELNGWYAVGFCVVCVAVMAYGASKLRLNVVTEHHVIVIRRLADGDFAYKSDEKPEGDTYRPCPIDRESGIDVDGMLTKALGGYVADKATWEEQGVCRSILKPEWGFWFRDEANNFTYQQKED